jgi:hypothetical protein
MGKIEYARLEQGFGVSVKTRFFPPSSLAWQQPQKIDRYVTLKSMLSRYGTE